jgi:hypothetical protein
VKPIPRQSFFNITSYLPKGGQHGLFWLNRTNLISLSLSKRVDRVLEGFSKISTYSAIEISSLMANLSKKLFLQGQNPSANANLTIEEK